MFWNMVSCSRTWNSVPKTCSMFKNMNHVLEHEIMFRPWFLVLNMASCYRTWNHVLKHDFMFWNMISCSGHVQPEHDFVMFEHVLNMPEHVLNIEHVQACSGPWTWSEHGGHLVDDAPTAVLHKFHRLGLLICYCSPISNCSPFIHRSGSSFSHR